MKVLLKSNHSQMFVTEDGRWVRQPEQAADFRLPLNAMNFCQLNHLNDVSILVDTGDDKYEMPLRCDEE